MSGGLDSRTPVGSFLAERLRGWYVSGVLSASQKRFLRSLQRKRERQEAGCFLAGGPTLVREAMVAGWPILQLVCTPDWRPPAALRDRCVEVTADELAAVSAVESPNQVLAVVRAPAETPAQAPAGLALALDGIQDPGNLGTILRTAAWFGVERVICSPACVERFNPKVVQASMGAVFQVPVHVTPLAPFLAGLPPAVCVAGACLEGESVYGVRPVEPAVVVLGNEARGISDDVARSLRCRLTIPRIGAGESLNVAMAAAILCSEWRRAASARPSS